MKDMQLVLQFYDQKEAQKAIIRLGSNFSSVQSFPRSKKIRVNTNFSSAVPSDEDEIISIETFTYAKTDYVYDLSTESEHFQAGLGCIIVHNTDSVMLSLPSHWSEEESFNKAISLSKEITQSLFEPPCKLEFEKIWNPYILVTKKRYTGLKKESYNDEAVIDIKGMAPVRRENSFIVVDFVNQCLELLLREKNPCQVYLQLEMYLEKIVNGGFDISKFVMSKAIKDVEEYKEPPAHRLLATNYNRRVGFEHYSAGDRVEYVQFVPPDVVEEFERRIAQQPCLNFSKNNPVHKPNTRNIKGHFKIEDPVFAKERKLMIDYDYYITALESKLTNIIQFYSIHQDVATLFHEKKQIFDTPSFLSRKRKIASGGSSSTKKKDVPVKVKKTMKDFYQRKN